MAAPSDVMADAAMGANLAVGGQRVTPHSSDLDVYGFAVDASAAQQKVRDACAAKSESRRQQYWARYAEFRRLPTDDRKVKKLCRKGVPPNERSWVWPVVSGAAAIKARNGADYFARCLGAASGLNGDTVKQIDLDLARTYPEHEFMATREGQEALRSVLLAYAVHNLSVGYCQGMNYVAGLLLLAMDRQPEAAFWVFVALLEGRLEPGTFDKGITGCQVEVLTLEALVAKRNSALLRHMQQFNMSLIAAVPQWFLSLFCQDMPMETVARIFDTLLLEGSKILQRVALATLKLSAPQLQRERDGVAIVQTLRAFTRAQYDHHELMHVAFKGVGRLRRADLTRIRARARADVQRRPLPSPRELAPADALPVVPGAVAAPAATAVQDSEPAAAAVTSVHGQIETAKPPSTSGSAAPSMMVQAPTPSASGFDEHASAQPSMLSPIAAESQRPSVFALLDDGPGSALEAAATDKAEPPRVNGAADSLRSAASQRAAAASPLSANGERSTRKPPLDMGSTPRTARRPSGGTPPLASPAERRTSPAPSSGKRSPAFGRAGSTPLAERSSADAAAQHHLPPGADPTRPWRHGMAKKPSNGRRMTLDVSPSNGNAADAGMKLAVTPPDRRLSAPTKSSSMKGSSRGGTLKSLSGSNRSRWH